MAPGKAALPDTEVALSNEDISNILGPSVRVMTYTDVANCSSIGQVFGGRESVVLLFRLNPNFGHWTALIKRGNKNIEHFDSLGHMIDDQLSWIERHFREQSKQVLPHLTMLLLKSGLNVEYNNHHLQQDSPLIKTCGRWCCLRIIFSRYDIDAFARAIKSLTKRLKVSPDELVCMLIRLQ
jgi:hypothetical protein